MVSPPLTRRASKGRGGLDLKEVENLRGPKEGPLPPPELEATGESQEATTLDPVSELQPIDDHATRLDKPPRPVIDALSL
jgi:hypothetical protein